MVQRLNAVRRKPDDSLRSESLEYGRRCRSALLQLRQKRTCLRRACSSEFDPSATLGLIRVEGSCLPFLPRRPVAKGIRGRRRAIPQGAHSPAQPCAGNAGTRAEGRCLKPLLEIKFFMPTPEQPRSFYHSRCGGRQGARVPKWRLVPWAQPRNIAAVLGNA